MSDKSDEVREWWIDDRDNGDGYVVHDEHPTHVQNELIHVIEKSAYDALKKELFSEHEYAMRMQDAANKHEKERDELIEAHDAQVKIAKEFQKLFREIEPEMSKLTQENERLNKQLALVSDSSLQISTQLAEQNKHLRQLLSEARDLFNRMSKFEIIDEELVKTILTKLNKALGPCE